MDERYLQQLTRTRQHHVLACLRILGGSELDALAGLDPARDPARTAPADLGSLVRFSGPGPHQVAWLVGAEEPAKARNARAVAAARGR
jgi:hypothetical protein